MVTPEPSPRATAACRRGLDQLRSLGLAARGIAASAIRERRDARRRSPRDRVLLDERRGGGELAGEELPADARARAASGSSASAPASRTSSTSGGEGAASSRPETQRPIAAGEPEPAQPRVAPTTAVRTAQARAAARARRPRSRRSISTRQPSSSRSVGRGGRAGGRRRGPPLATSSSRRSREAAGEHRRDEALRGRSRARARRRAARAARRCAQQQRRRVAAAASRERDLGAQHVRPGRAGARPAARARAVASSASASSGRRPGAWPARRRARARRAAPGRASARPPLQERRRGRQAAAGLRAIGRALELGGDRLVGPGCGLRAVPGAAVGIDLGVGRLGERPCTRRRSSGDAGAVDGRPHQRMPEPHPRPISSSPRLGAGAAARPDARAARPRARPARLADRLGGGDQQQSPRRRRAALRAGAEALLDATWRAPAHPAARSRRPARPASARGAARAAPAGCPGSRRRSGRAPARPADRTAERAARAHRRRAGPPTASSGRPAKLARAGSRTANTIATRLRQQPPGDERQRLRRGLIEPLRVVDHADQRPLLGHLGQQAQHRQADEEAIRGGAGAAGRTRLAAPRAAAPGSASSRSSNGAHSWCRPAYASSISDSTPAARATGQPDADSTRYSSSAVLPMPASPRRTSDRLSPRRMSRPGRQGGALSHPAVAAHHRSRRGAALRSPHADAASDAPEGRRSAGRSRYGQSPGRTTRT